MTENELIKTHIEECEERIGRILGYMETAEDANTKFCKHNVEVLKSVVIALEEIQQYRAIGTVESLKNLPTICDSLAESSMKAEKLIEELKAYQSIGTIEEFKALKEKNEPKKIDIWANGEEHCPFCDKNLTTFYSFANCFSCGQALDWQ